MATILRGRHKGKIVKIHQFCNDWMHISHADIDNRDSILNPTNLLYTPEEKERIEKAETAGRTGTMFYVYEWDNLNIKKKRLFRNSNF